MKIAFLSKEFPPCGQNFASALFYPKLASALVQKGHEVHVVSQSVKREETCEQDGVAVQRVGPPPKSGSAWTRMKNNFHAWLKLKQVVREHQIQLVDSPVTFGEGFIYSLLKKTPIVLQTFAFSARACLDNFRMHYLCFSGEILILHQRDRVLRNTSGRLVNNMVS